MLTMVRAPLHEIAGALLRDLNALTAALAAEGCSQIHVMQASAHAGRWRDPDVLYDDAARLAASGNLTRSVGDVLEVHGGYVYADPERLDRAFAKLFSEWRAQVDRTEAAKKEGGISALFESDFAMRGGATALMLAYGIGALVRR